MIYLKGTIRSNSNIMCEIMITSDNAFFNKIGLEKTNTYLDSEKQLKHEEREQEWNLVSI